MERNSVRTNVGLFDLCHMGQIMVKGADAERFVDRLVCSEVAPLAPGQALYSLLCNESGGIVDDLVVFRQGENELRLVVNASRREVDLSWMRRWCPSELEVEILDLTGKSGLLAIQGPSAAMVMSPLIGDMTSLQYYHFKEVRIDEHSCLISRTGYTGEDGFEVIVDEDESVLQKEWEIVREVVLSAGGHVCGLGARDLLRLEAGYALWGNEIDEQTDPYSAGLGWVVEVDKGSFVGQDALKQMKQSPPERRLVTIVVEGPRVPRHGADIIAGGNQIGCVTSGSFSPLTESGVALGYVKRGWDTPGTAIQVDIGGRLYPAQVHKRPLYRGSVGEGRKQIV
jgi:aminomethyltransferase